MGRPLREFQFKDLCQNVDPSILSGKIVFKNSEGVSISFDDSIVSDEKIILLEIDASNMAKLTTGQFILLHALKDFPAANCHNLVDGKEIIFFVIHCYGSSKKNNKFNAERTQRNFKLINSIGFQPIPCGSIHIEDFINQNFTSKVNMIQFIKNNVIE